MVHPFCVRLSRRCRYAALLTAAVVSPGASASVWNGGINQNWSDPSQWTPAFVPGAGIEQNASIGSGSAILDQTFTIQNFDLTGGALVGSSGQQLTVQGTFNLDGGIVNGGTINVAGPLNWISGFMNGGGATHIAAAGSLNLSGAADKVLSNRQLVSDGAIVWTGGNLIVNQGASIASSSLLDIQSNAAIVLPDATGAQLINTGTLHKSAGGGMTSIAVPFDSSGAVIVSSGTLSIERGGVGSGSFITQPGAVLRFASGETNSYTLAAGATLSNGGTVINAGYLRAPATLLTGGNLVMDSTTARELFVEGDLPVSEIDWTRGVLSGPGTSTSATQTFTADWGVGGGRVLQNSGALNWNAGNWGLGLANSVSQFDPASPGTIHNLSSGGFEINFDAALGLPAAPQLLVLDNAGVITIGSGHQVSIHAVMTNSGTILTEPSSTLHVLGGGTHGGVLQLANNSRISFEGAATHTFTSTAHVTDSGTVVFDAATTDFAGTVHSPAKVRFGMGSNSTATTNLLGSSSITTSSFHVAGGTVHLAGALDASSGSVNVQNGLLEVQSGAATIAAPTVVGAGATGLATLRVNAGATYAASTLTADLLGVIDLNGGTISSAAPVLLQGGTVTGHGTIDGALTSVGGSILPGDSTILGDTQTLLISGDIALDAASVVSMDINSSAITSDRLVGGNSVELGSALLALVLTGPPTIDPTQTFTIATATGAVSGTFTPFSSALGSGWIDVYDSSFTTVLGAFEITYLDDMVLLSSFQVPEPAASGALLIGTFCLLRRRS